ncbi:sensor histidine kinase [Flaviaesturariibacter amylovorans]|uniref:histidine kinase n=1 Tax=Flaviaesturariibacter amylovorans TaxID=1084520 RepID=A0ABP8GHU9_9BACT
MNNPTHGALPFLNGGGEMGALIRSKDWSRTPLGPPETWPQSLRTTVSLLLNSQFPMFVWWGPELIALYNDAYVPIAGEKHPTMLGQSGRIAWEEIWSDLGSLVDSVFAGISTWSEDQLLVMNRRGYFEETYFTFSYSPVLNDEGAVGGLFCACIETTGKVLAARRILESEQNLRNTILQAPVAMCILRNPGFVVEIANERMYALWGRGQAELQGKPIFEGLPEARHQGLEEILQNVVGNGVAFTANERPVQLPRDGSVQTVYINFVYEPFRDGDGNITGLIAVAVDVSEQVRARRQIEEIVVQRTGELATANDALIKSNQELKRSNNNLEEFAYAASHDMKEPIRKIHFFADRLRGELQPQLSDNQRLLFERLESASRRMGALIDDLLTYSQATRGAAEQETIDLNRRLEQVLHDLELEIEQKGARVQVGPLPTLRGNGRQFQQLFQNLVSNALKYSRPGVPPVVEIRAGRLPGSDPLVQQYLPEAGNPPFVHHVEVADNGIGFEQSDAERIFNMFTRLHGNAEYRGTGVGLSIVRKVVDNHGGHIWADSRPGEGTTFHILLPDAAEYDLRSAISVLRSSLRFVTTFAQLKNLCYGIYPSCTALCT